MENGYITNKIQDLLGIEVFYQAGIDKINWVMKAGRFERMDITLSLFSYANKSLAKLTHVLG